MRKILLSTVAIAAMVFGANQNASAQTSATANVIVAVNVSDVLAMTATVPLVTFGLTSSTNYSGDQETSMPAQLAVVSTQPFDLAVRSQQANFTSLGASTLPLDILKVESTNNNLNATMNPAITLTNANQQLFDEADAGLAQLINLKYTLRTVTNFAAFNTAAAGAYTTTLVYTATID